MAFPGVFGGNIPQILDMPQKHRSLQKFAVIGNSGTGGSAIYRWLFFPGFPAIVHVVPSDLTATEFEPGVAFLETVP